MTLEGEVALVTGASRGIGMAIARGLVNDPAIDFPTLDDDVRTVVERVVLYRSHLGRGGARAFDAQLDEQSRSRARRALAAGLTEWRR